FKKGVTTVKIFVVSVLLLVTVAALSFAQQQAAQGAAPKGNIAFLSTRDGNFEIYTMNVDGSNLRNLTNNKATDFWMSWSSDGSRLLFYSNREGNNEIYMMNADGSHLVNLSRNPSDDRLPAWSPDGRRVAFVSNRGQDQVDLYMMDIDGGNIRRLTDNKLYEEVPAWSPDGKRLAFTREVPVPGDTSGAPHYDIFVMNADGTGEVRLTNLEGFASGAAWSPDGKRIAFYLAEGKKISDIFIMDNDGKNIQNVTNDSTENYSPSWSPDGQWIAYTSGSSKNYDVSAIRSDGTNRVRLTDHPKRDETPVWQPVVKPKK
ncbi:MAG TPA: DPP IV N-terminal domain-containing protein, partial [Bacteroidota bacterium]